MTHDQPCVPFVFEGFVIDPDGAPAEGAVVASSAGGRAIVDRSGRYRLEALVPVEAESLQISAIDTSEDRAANASIDVTGASRLVRVDLLLSQGLTCPPKWLPTFGQQPGVSGSVNALVEFDDGSGAALYVGGGFVMAGGAAANGIAKWDGSNWSALGSGIDGVYDDVRSLAVWDDGSGPSLYVAGRFETAGGVPAVNIARWNGTGWSALGGGLGATWTGRAVTSLAVFDDGSGPALYAGGEFTSAGGLTVNRIARWDGSSWTSLGTGLNEAVHALAVYDDGSGPALYAGGDFTSAGGAPANQIARWDGSSWTALGSGTNSRIAALTVYDDGSGPALHAGGYFVTAGGTTANRVAKWDGSIWSPLAFGVHSFCCQFVSALAVYDDGSGPALYAGGDFTSASGVAASRIAKWDGSSWSALGAGVDTTSGSVVRSLAVHAKGDGQALYAGGAFATAGSLVANHIATWDGSSWAPLGRGMSRDVLALMAHDDGSGPSLFAGGGFTSAGAVGANRIAKWDGSSWSALGGGMDGDVRALALYDDGSGRALFAGGRFTTAGGVSAKRIARWDGSSWSPLGGGFPGPSTSSVAVHALCVYDDGSGPALYAGGYFLQVGSLPVNWIARWDGSSWSALGSGMDSSVSALTVHDDGSGPALYAGGTFTTAGGAAASRIAKWDGTSWSALGGGVNDEVETLVSFDDGSGPALFVGGRFTGTARNRIAKWDGSGWTSLGSGMTGAVMALAVYDDGNGPAVYAGGSFTTAGGLAANRIARWDGSNWTPLGSGMSGDVLALTAHDDGTGPALYSAGSFTNAVDSGDSYIAKWGCPLTRLRSKARVR